MKRQLRLWMFLFCVLAFSTLVYFSLGVYRVDADIENGVRKLQALKSFQLSADMPENNIYDLDRYTAVIEPYFTPVDKFYVDQQNSSESQKIKFIDRTNPNIGWKIHLNVAPENLVYVSEYLLNKGYCHKYLTGGLPEEGKIFTVYIGSLDLMVELSKKISFDLQDYLAHPATWGEIEFARGISGRFNRGRDKFWEYSSSGFALLLDGLDGRYRSADYVRNYPKEYYKLEVNSFKYLYREYGDYFFNPVWVDKI